MDSCKTTVADTPCVKEKSFTFFGWNVGQANREQNTKFFHWDARSESVKEHIAAVGADIIVLLELRKLPNAKEGVTDFLADERFRSYFSACAPYCHYEQSFYFAVLAKEDKFVIRNTRTKRFHGDPTNDKTVMLVDLEFKVGRRDEKVHTITVGVTHFDMGEARKDAAVHVLKQILLDQPHPTMCFGDFNFFDDRNGIAQRNCMLEQCVDVAHPLFVAPLHNNAELAVPVYVGAEAKYAMLQHKLAAELKEMPKTTVGVARMFAILKAGFDARIMNINATVEHLKEDVEVRNAIAEIVKAASKRKLDKVSELMYPDTYTTEALLSVVGVPRKDVVLRGGDRLPGTFVGFPHDDYCAKYGNFSRLDHVFVNKHTALVFKPALAPFASSHKLENDELPDEISDKTPDECCKYKYPSDHLGIYLRGSLVC